MMKNAKKWLAAVLAGLMLLSTAACGDGAKKDTTAAQTDDAAPSFEQYKNLSPSQVLTSLEGAEQVKITLIESWLDEEELYKYTTVITREGEKLELSTADEDYESVEYVDFEAGKSYYQGLADEWISEDAFVASWDELLDMFRSDGYEVLFKDDNFTADGDHYTITAKAGQSFINQYGADFAETYGEQDVKLNASIQREGTKYTFEIEVTDLEGQVLNGSEIVIEFCQTSVTLPSIAGEDDSDDPDDEEEQIPGDTVLTSEYYASLDFTRYLETADLSAIKGSLADIEAEWQLFVNDVRLQNIILTDAAAGERTSLYDEVNIHYKGYAASSDVTLSEGTLSNMTNINYDEEGNLTSGYDTVLGSGEFIGAYESEAHPEKNNKSFEEQLVGMKAGETRTITVTFPDNYGSDELNGTVIKFDVTVNSIKKGTLPELTDEMIAEYTGEEYTTIAGVKEYIDSYNKGDFAYLAVTGAIEVKDYPINLVDDAISEYVANYIQYTYEEELTNAETEKIFEEQYENARAYAENMVGQDMVLEYLFKEYGLTMTQDEYLETRKRDYEDNYFYYYYYYGIADEKTLEDVFTKDVLVRQYKADKLKTVLADKIVFE